MGLHARKQVGREVGRNVIKMPHSLPPIENGKRAKRNWKREAWVLAIDVVVVGGCFGLFLWAAGVFVPAK